MEMSEFWPDTSDKGYIHQFQQQFTSSSRSTEFKYILPWNISQMITQRPFQSAWELSYAKWWNKIFCFEFYRKSIVTEKTTWSDFPNGENTIVGQILEPEEINKSKRVELQESQLEIRVGKLNIWVRSFEINCKTMHMSNGILKG